MEPEKRLPGMLASGGAALQQVLLPPIATLSGDSQHEAASLAHLGTRLAPGSSGHATADCLASALQQGAAPPAIAEPAQKKPRRLVGAPLVIGQQAVVHASVASSASGRNSAYHAASATHLQGICSIVPAGPSPQAMGLHFPGQTLGPQRDVLLQVPMASLQAINGVGAAVPGAQRVLPIFRHHTNASAAPVVSTAAPDHAPMDGNSMAAAAAASGPHHLLSGHGLSHLAGDAGSNGRGSSNSSTTTAGNQNSNSGSNSDDDGSREQDDGPTSRRLARREYHKKIERKRRDRMRSLYDELRALTDAAELADKNGVLEGAIGLINQLREENAKLSQELLRCAGDRAAPQPSLPVSDSIASKAPPAATESTTEGAPSPPSDCGADAGCAAVNKIANTLREREIKLPSAVL